MWYKNVGTSFVRFVTNNMFEAGQTDRRTDSILMAIPCVALHAVALLKVASRAVGHRL